MNEKSFYHRLPYTHEEIEELFAKIKGREALLADDYEKLINVIGIDNISTFSGNYEDLKNLPDIPKSVSDLINDLDFQTADDVYRKLEAVRENLIILINEYENDSELEYAKNTALENQAETLKLYTDIEIEKAIKRIDLTGFATKTSVNLKADAIHNHQVTDIDGLESRLQVSEKMVDKLYDKHLEFVDKQHKHDNKEVIDKLTQKKIDEWDNFLKTTDEKILLKADKEHNHDDRYADKDDEHNHWNLSVLNNINADTIENLNKRVFVAYHDGLDTEGKYISDEEFVKHHRPLLDGNLNGWRSFTGDPVVDADIDISKAIWMSHKIDTYIDEGIWSTPIKIVGKTLKTMKTQYALSSSATEPPSENAEWSDNLPEEIGDKYLWSRLVLIWERPDGITYTTPIRQNLDDILRGTEEIQKNMVQELTNIRNEFNEHKEFVTSECNTLYAKVNELANEISTKESELNSKITALSNYSETTYQKKSDMGAYSTTTQMNNAIKNESNAIKSSVASTYQTIEDMKNYTTTADMNDIISAEFKSLKDYSDGTFQTKAGMKDYMTSTEILSLFESNEGNMNSTLNNYVTKTDLSNYYNKTETSDLISNSASTITTNVANTYQTKSDMSSYSTTSQVQNLISQSANTITTNVANTYQTKSGMSSYSTTSHTHTAVNGITVSKMSQSSYDSASKNANTFYIIVG